MSISAGTLEVQMLANLARLQQDMNQAKGIVGGAVKSMETAVAGLKAALGGIAAGISVAAFANSMRAVIDMADNLRDLSKTTNVAIEDLAGLKLAAQQSGGELEGIAASINKLATNMGKEGEKFKALGVTAKDPLKALQELADVFVSIKDPQLRAAVAAEALGKSWASAAPLLSEGGKRIGEMVENGKRLSGITAGMADDADEFNDKLAEMNTTLGATKTKLAADLLPSMNEIARAMQEAAKESGALKTAWVGLGGVMAWLLGMTEAQKVRERLGEITKQMDIARKQLASGTLNPEGASDSFWGFLIPNVRLTEEAKTKLRETIKALEAERAGLSPAKIPDAPGDPNADAAAAARAREFLKGEKEAKLAAAELLKYENALKSLEDQLGKFNDETVEEQTLRALSIGSLKDLTEGHQRHLLEVARAVDAHKQAKIALDAYVKSMEMDAALEQEVADLMAARATKEGEAIKAQHEYLEGLRFEAGLVGQSNVARETAVALRALEKSGIDKTSAEYERLVVAINAEVQAKNAAEALNQKTIEQIQFETSLISLNTIEREQAIAVRQLELIGIKTNTEEYEKYAAALKHAISDKNAVQASQERWVGMWSDVERAAKDTFVSIFDAGKSSFDRLRDALKNGLYRLLYEMTLRPFLVQVVTTVAGTGVAERAFGASATQGSGTGLPPGVNISDLGKLIPESVKSRVADFLGFGGTSGAGAMFGSTLPASAIFDTGSALGSSFGSLSSVSGSIFDTAGSAFGSAVDASSIFATGADTFSSAASSFGGAAFDGAGAALGAASSYLPYVGALIQLATGNVRGAAFTAAGAAIGSIIPGIGTAIGAVIGSIIGSLTGSKSIPARTIDHGGSYFSPTGERLSYTGSQGQLDVTTGISKGLVEVAEMLGAKLPAYALSFGSNTGKDSKEPNFDLAASVGGANDPSTQRNVFHSGEIMGQSNKLDQETLALRSAQAMIAVLKEATMPKYLADFFKALKPASEMSKSDVDNVLQYVEQLQSAHKILEKIASLSNLKATADELVDLFGNLQTATPLLQSYYDNFFAQAEQQSEGIRQVTAAMKALGITTIPATRDEFRKLVEAQDLTTDAGKDMFRALIAIAPAFAAVTEAAADQTDALTDIVSKWGDVARTLREYASELAGGTAGASSYASTRSAFSAISMSARLGDIDAATKLRDAGEAFRTASLATSTSSVQYARDLALIRSGVNGAIATADQQVSIAQKQLDELRNITAALGGVPGHAGGGTAQGWSWVGERGPELAYFGSPTQIYSNADSRRMFGGGGDPQTAAEVRALREEVALLRTENNNGNLAIARQTAKSARLQDTQAFETQPASETSITAVASTATSRMLLPANGARKGLTLVNTDANDAYVKFGQGASATSFTVKMRGGRNATYEMDKLYTGRIDVVWASAGSGHMVATES